MDFFVGALYLATFRSSISSVSNCLFVIFNLLESLIPRQSMPLKSLLLERFRFVTKSVKIVGMSGRGFFIFIFSVSLITKSKEFVQEVEESSLFRQFLSYCSPEREPNGCGNSIQLLVGVL